MSIEQQLAELTTAVNNLTAVISSKIGAGVASQVASAPEKAPPAAKDPKPDPKSETAAAKSAPPADTPATPAPTAAASGEIDFASQIQKPIVAMAAAGKRAQAMEILKACGASRASEIKPEDYAKAVELIAKAG